MGISMKDTIKEEEKELKRILKRSGLNVDDRQRVMAIFRDMAYRWCDINANYCAMEKHMEKQYPETWKNVLRTFLHNPGYHEEYARKMNETVPRRWLDGDFGCMEREAEDSSIGSVKDGEEAEEPKAGGGNEQG